MAKQVDLVPVESIKEATKNIFSEGYVAEEGPEVKKEDPPQE